MRTSWLRLVLPAVLLAGVFAIPAVAADEPPTRKELLTSQNNMKQIGIAHHAYYDVHRKMGGDIYSKDGKPLLSWRVAVLPFIGEDVLFKTFSLNEPWDSDNNKKLIEKMPKTYAPVRVKAKAGETFYQTFTGKDTLFGDNGPIYRLDNIPDGMRHTALVVEAGAPVIWSKPADLAFDEKKALPKLGGLFDGVFHVGLCDGSVIRVKKDFDEKVMKLLIMPADGFVIDLDDFDKLTK